MVEAGDTIYETITEACRWLKEKVGYGCDGKAERWIGTTYMRFKYGIKDCNSFCVKYHGKPGGQCNQTSNYDTSFWCPLGQTGACTKSGLCTDWMVTCFMIDSLLSIKIPSIRPSITRCSFTVPEPNSNEKIDFIGNETEISFQNLIERCWDHSG